MIDFLRQILRIVKIQFTLQEMKLSNVFSDSAIIIEHSMSQKLDTE